jgi:hypothetical protein
MKNRKRRIEKTTTEIAELILADARDHLVIGPVLLHPDVPGPYFMVASHNGRFWVRSNRRPRSPRQGRRNYRNEPASPAGLSHSRRRARHGQAVCLPLALQANPQNP